MSTDDRDDDKEENAQKTYLVTGANQGLGLEAVRQLALLPQTKRVYMACRTESKALAAIKKLVEENSSNRGIDKNKLVFVSFDASDSKEMIAKKNHRGFLLFPRRTRTRRRNCDWMVFCSMLAAWVMIRLANPQDRIKSWICIR